MRKKRTVSIHFIEDRRPTYSLRVDDNLLETYLLAY